MQSFGNFNHLLDTCGIQHEEFGELIHIYIDLRMYHGVILSLYQGTVRTGQGHPWGPPIVFVVHQLDYMYPCINWRCE